MKNLFLVVFVCFSCQTNGQKVALLHRDFKQPIIYTDSVTIEQISSGYFAVEITNFDTLIANLKFLREMLSTRQRAKMESFELRAGSTVIKTARLPFAYGDRYNISAQTKVGEIQSNFSLSDSKKTNAKNAERIDELLKYMSSNKALFKAPNEIHPKIYNVQVVSER